MNIKNGFSFGMCGMCGLLALAVGRVGSQSPASGITVTPTVGVQQPSPGIRVGPPALPPDPKNIATLPEDFGPNLRGPRPGNVIQPIFNLPGTEKQQIDRINGVVDRAIELGNVVPNYQRIADTLEKGFPKILGIDMFDDGAKPKAVADPRVRLADNNDPKEGPPAPVRPSGNPNTNGVGNNNAPTGQESGFKQSIDEINKIFKTQAELIRSIDVGSVRRNGAEGGEESVVVATGRTGLQLSLIPATLYDHIKVPRDQGLMISDVFAKTPAEAAGYKKNDILIELNGKMVPSNLVDFLAKVMSTVKNDVPFSGVVLRGGQRIEIESMKVTDRRVVPALPNERLPNYNSVIQVVPGINSDQQNTNRVPEVRMIRTQTSTGITTEIIRVDPGKK